MILLHNNSSSNATHSSSLFKPSPPMGKYPPSPPRDTDTDSIEDSKDPLHVRLASHRIIRRTTTFFTRQIAHVVPSAVADPAAKPPRHGDRQRDSSKRLSRRKPSSSSSHPAKNGAAQQQPEPAVGSEPVRLDVAPPSKKWRDFFTPDEFSELNLTTSEATHQEVVFEIIRTEADYLADLKLVHKIFIKSAKEHDIPVPKNINMLFSNIVDMIILHQPILRMLESRKSKYWPVIPTVSDIFMDNIFGFNIYGSYLINFESGIRTIEEALQMDFDPFGAFMRQQIARPELRNLTLQGFLLKPVQRLTKYPLFFKNLLECRTMDHPDFWQTAELLRQMDETIRRMQEEKRKSDDMARLQELEQKIKGLQIYPEFKLAIPGRMLVFEGPLSVLRGMSQPKGQSSSSASSSTSSLSSTLNGNSKSSSLSIPPLPPTSALTSASSDTTQPAFVAPQDEKKVQSTTMTQLYVFLFNDIILWTKKIRGGYSSSYKLVEPPAKVTHVLDMAGTPTGMPGTLVASISSPGALGITTEDPFDKLAQSGFVSESPAPSSPVATPASTLSVASSYFAARPPSVFSQPPPRTSQSQRSSLSRGSHSRSNTVPPPGPNPSTMFEVTSVHRHCITFLLQASSEDVKHVWVGRLRDSIRTHTNRSDKDGTDKFWALRGVREEQQIFRRLSLDEANVRNRFGHGGEKGAKNRASVAGYATMGAARRDSTILETRVWEEEEEEEEEKRLPEDGNLEDGHTIGDVEMELNDGTGIDISEVIAAVLESIPPEMFANGSRLNNGIVAGQFEDAEMDDAMDVEGDV